jgi:hypothetical protein
MGRSPKGFFAIFRGFFRESGRKGRGTIMNLELSCNGCEATAGLANSGRDGTFFRHFQSTEFLGKIAE